MTFPQELIKPLPPIHFPVGAHFTVVRASLWTTDADRIVATFDHFVVALLHSLGPVVLSVIPTIHPGRLGETEKRNEKDPRDD